MLQIKRTWLAAVALAAFGAAGCGPGMAPVGVQVAVRRPPPERVEVVGTAPGPGYIWVRGHWAWQGGDYVWVPGQWQAAPRATVRSWVPGHWQRARGGWYWVEGHWQ